MPSPTGAPTGTATAIPTQIIPVPVPITTAAASQQSPATANNMFYHHTGDPSATAALQQPMFYNTAYPINIPTYATANHYDPTGAAAAAAYFSSTQPIYNPALAAIAAKNNQHAPVQQPMNAGGPGAYDNNSGHYIAQPLQQPQMPPQPTPRAINKHHQKVFLTH